MSAESAKAFIKRMKTDKEFARKVSEYKDAEAGMAFLKGEGYSFTLEEMQKEAAELTDEALGKVVGGIGMSGAGTFVK